MAQAQLMRPQKLTQPQLLLPSLAVRQHLQRARGWKPLGPLMRVWSQLFSLPGPSAQVALCPPLDCNAVYFKSAICRDRYTG